jgi:hypothetical protein
VRVAEKVAPIMGAVSALGALACCLPLGGAAALGLGGLVGVAAQYQEWMLPLSGGLLALGVGLVWRSRRICHATSKWSLVVLAVSALVVLLVLIVPQTVVGFLADYLS